MSEDIMDWLNPSKPQEPDPPESVPPKVQEELEKTAEKLTAPTVPEINVKYPSAREFILLMQAVKVIIVEAVWTFTDELRVRAMDPSHVAMLDLTIPYEAWEEWDVPGDWHTGVNIEWVLRSLPKPKKDEDSLRLETVPDRDRLRWTVQTGSLKRSVEFNLLALEPEEIPIVRIDFKAKVRLTVEALKTIIEDACKVSENIRVETPDGEKVTFSASGDMGPYSVTLDKYTEDLLALEVREPTKATYSLSYLKASVDAAAKLTETVSLSWANNMPLKLDVELLKTTLSYWIAPYVE